MSSTTGIQNFLVNVFRPVYTYDPLTTIYTVKLELSNIDTYSGNTVSVFTAAVGDSASNVYVGSNAGNVFTNTRASSNVVALGYGAGSNISNVSNSTYLGNAAGAAALNANAVIAIGTGAGGNGTSNIFIGNGTKSTGSNNILVGHGIDIGASNNTLRLGSTLYGNLSTKWIGIGTPSPYDANDKLDVSGNVYVLGQVGINITPGNRTLDVNGNFRAADSSGNTLDFNSGVVSSTGGFTSIRGSRSVGSTGTISIATLKKGLIMIMVSSGATNFDGRTVMVLDTATPTVSNLSSNNSGTTTVNFTSNSINISNATAGILLYDWAVTYFPLT
jgi:hypothetical protein